MTNSHQIENPCFTCKVKINGEIRRGPCCDDLAELHMTEPQYRRNFENKDGVRVVRRYTDNWLGEIVIIAFLGKDDQGHRPCVHHNSETGLCDIHSDRPDACRAVEPGHDILCVQGPEGFVALRDIFPSLELVD